jgi:hypothetical protein
MELSAEKAEQDFAAGKYYYYCEGQASLACNVFGRYLQEHYNVIFCTIAHSTPAYVEYSGRMLQLLNEHFGKNIFKEAESAVWREYEKQIPDMVNGPDHYPAPPPQEGDPFPWLGGRVLPDFSQWEPPSGMEGTAFAKRRRFFERHPEHCNGQYACPACGYPTMECRNFYSYCSLCHWEDDGQDDPWANYQNGGPNDGTLTQARLNFPNTFCYWSLAEKKDFSPERQYRLFSAEAFEQKKKLCALYDGLMELSDDDEIEKQWEKINAQWVCIPK